MVQIYYWEHDQSEERPLEEFFRGDANSLIQWQPLAMGSMPVAGMPLGGVPMGAGYGDMPMQGIPLQGGPDAGAGLYGTVEGAAMPLEPAVAMLNGT